MNTIKELFMLDPDVVFLNHGSFGACPIPVFEVYQEWQRKLERQPVAFISKELSIMLSEARLILGQHINASPDEVVYIPNATYGVNTIAQSISLKQGDEILATDHEYGACRNAWIYVCRKTGATYKEQSIPLPLQSQQEIVEAFWTGVTDNTKMIFMSHITSPTAVHLPIEEICARAHQADILIMIDGAHTPGHIPINMRTIGADFYIGNCHKWLMAPKGSAFLYTQKERQWLVKPLIVSWGWGENKTITTGSEYLDNLEWVGTNDPSAYLTVPAAIQFQIDYNWDIVMKQCHQLLDQALSRICKLVSKPSYYVDNQVFHQMAIAPLPYISDFKGFKERLFWDFSIEIPCIEWNDMQLLRISIQGYNSQSDIDRLMIALDNLLPEYSTI